MFVRVKEEKKRAKTEAANGNDVHGKRRSSAQRTISSALDAASSTNDLHLSHS